VKRLAAAAAALLAPACAHEPWAPTCEAIRAGDAAWAYEAVGAWETTRREILSLPPMAQAPTVVLFDEACVFTARVGGEWDGTWGGQPHGGEVTLPDGGSVPVQVASFAAPFDDNRQVYLAMALLSVWQAAGVESGLTLETLMTAVLVHEMTHTEQFAAYNPLIDGLIARWDLGADITDDAVQDRFGAAPEVSASIDRERDLLFAAAFAPSDEEARALAREALALIEARNAAHHVGADAKYAEIEDVFLSLEGSAQWAAFAWLTDERGAGYTAEEALPLFRRGGKKWSQDEGLAIFLVVDRLVPGWIDRAFAAEDPATAMTLLREAAR
jgi:hypothetical protein